MSPRPWQLRLLIQLRGNQTKYGCVLVAVMGHAPDHAPRYVSNAIVDTEGNVVAAFQGRNMLGADFVVVDKIEDFVENWRRIADEAKLSDDERVDLFKELRLWINDDARVGASNLT
jgi:hypothetical protein